MANATLIGIDLGKHCFFVQAQGARARRVRVNPLYPMIFRVTKGWRSSPVRCRELTMSEWREIVQKLQVARRVSVQYLRRSRS
jgi:hypothetical protein